MTLPKHKLTLFLALICVGVLAVDAILLAASTEQSLPSRQVPGKGALTLGTQPMRIATTPASVAGARRTAEFLSPPTDAEAEAALAGDGDVPVNDDCTAAIPLSGEIVLLPFNNVRATDDGPTPTCQENSHDNVWYCWTAEGDGDVEISLCDSSFDTVLSVYEGCDCSNLSEVVCDDDGCQVGSTSQVLMGVTAGSSYLISIGGWDTSSGTGVLFVSIPTPPYMGSCCVDDECVGTMSMNECNAQNGFWQFGGDCSLYHCGECPEGTDLVTVEVGTDEFPEETSWELVDHDSGEVLYSRDSYANADFPHYNSICLDSDGCYDFTIHDAGSNGLCCDHGSGYVNVTFGDTLVLWGNEFGDSLTTRFGGGCEVSPRACCIQGECIDSANEFECTEMLGVWHSGEICDTYVCPPSMIVCPDSATYGQSSPISGMTALVSDSAGDGTNNDLFADRFFGVTEPIHGIDWWGAWVTNDAGYVSCEEPDPTVEIKFYEDANGRPGDVVCEYEAVPTWTTTDIMASGSFELLHFSVDLLQPACVLSDGWVSIQGVGFEPNCWMVWTTSNEGDGSSFKMSPFEWPFGRDLAFCLDSDYEPTFGACCDEDAGICANEVERIDCYGRFEEGLTCGELNPPCGVGSGACCYGDGSCEITSEASCSGNWLGEDTVCEMCPCVVTCPDGAIAEEEACGEFANDGCHMDDPSFNPITPGVPVCGTIWADGGVRDTDWYEIVTTENMVFTWTVEAEFETVPLLAGLVATNPLGTPDCSTATSFAIYGFAGPCEQISIPTICLPPGTYWLYVSAASTFGMPCGTNNDYVATLTAEPCLITGACCYDDGYECIENEEFECDSLGGQWFGYESCDDHECVITCPKSSIDVEVYTDGMPTETRWELTDLLTGEIVAAEGPYDQWGHLFVERACVSPERCYVFTIYDEWGNGLCCYHGEGQYSVYLDGGLVRSGGRFGPAESVYIGSSCPERQWACCVGGSCVGDLTETECLVMHGTPVDESTCSQGYDCTGQADFRLTAPIVDERGNSCAHDDDCDLYVGEDVDYLVTIPEDGVWTFSLCGSFVFYDAVIIVGTTRYGNEIGEDDRSCQLAGQLTAELPAGDYYVTVDGFSPEDCGNYVLNVIKLEECDTSCPAGATAEGEPVCYDGYYDETNGGCDGFYQAVSTIAPGETVCGTSGTYLLDGEIRGDADWYQIDLVGRASLKWNICPTFDAELSIIGSFVNDCSDNYTAATAPAEGHVHSSLGFTLDAGTYWLVVVPVAGTEVPCGSTYTATASVEYIAEPGACCHSDGCATLDYAHECYDDYTDGTWYIGENCAEDGGAFECPNYSACCMPDGYCMMAEGEFECMAFYGGTWHEGETCIEYGGGFECPVTISACCTPEGFCLMAGSAFECSEYFGGTWHDGQICVDDGGDFVCPGAPVPGACCTPDGFCVMTADEFECTVFIEGTWYDGETCIDDGGSFVCPSEPGWCNLDADEDVDYDDYAIFLDAFGGLVDGNPPEDAACDYDDSGAVGMSDFAAWMDCYRTFIGDPNAGPPANPNVDIRRSEKPDLRSQVPASTSSVVSPRPRSQRWTKQ